MKQFSRHPLHTRVPHRVPLLVAAASWNTLPSPGIPSLIIIASQVMGGRRTGHGNDLLDDVYELSILEYLLDVHLGADVLLGMLVVVSRGGGGGGLHNNSSNDSNSNDEQGLHIVGGMYEVGL